MIYLKSISDLFQNSRKSTFNHIVIISVNFVVNIIWNHMPTLFRLPNLYHDQYATEPTVIFARMPHKTTNLGIVWNGKSLFGKSSSPTPSSTHTHLPSIDRGKINTSLPHSHATWWQQPVYKWYGRHEPNLPKKRPTNSDNNNRKLNTLHQTGAKSFPKLFAAWMAFPEIPSSSSPTRTGAPLEIAP